MARFADDLACGIDDGAPRHDKESFVIEAAQRRSHAQRVIRY
jgi:hypothetical protein